ncbi:peptidylprolyl isomerase [candidate division KSB1 bacterium]|nr:peptidylprolyl isomerase [candidate division KSB1 bacterium]
MMTQMRENMPLIMWILVAAFLGTIVFSWGMGGFNSGQQLDGVVGKVGDREILYDRYNRLVQDRVQSERQRDTTATMDDAKVKQLRKQVWDDLVRSELMAAYRDKLGLVTSDAEVAFAVKNNPPSWLRTNQAFLTDGQFDRSKYDEFLRNPQSADILVSLEADYRESMGNQKVIDRIIAPIFVTPTEVWDEYVITSRKLNAAIVSFPARNYPVDSTSITAAEVERYYVGHKVDYQRKERRKLSYIAVPVVATREDSLQVIELAQEMVQRATAGESFAELAKEFSEDPGSAKQGGELGWFGRGRMVKEFDSTCFAAEIGKVVGPIPTRFGVHVIKVEARAGESPTDSAKAQHILVKWKVGQDTDERAAQKAKDFTDAAKTDGFDASAAKANLEIKETDWFLKSPQGSIPGLGALQPAMDFAFSSKISTISYVYRTKIKSDDAYIVCAVKDVSPEGVTPLTEVEHLIRGQLLRDKQEALALEAAKKFRARVNTPEAFLNAAARESLKVDTTGDHLQRDFFKGFGSDEAIAKSLLNLRPGQLSDALSNTRGGYVAVLLAKAEADSAAFAAKQKEISDRLRQTKQNSVYSDWLATAEKEIGVVDNRHLYYTDY